MKKIMLSISVLSILFFIIGISNEALAKKTEKTEAYEFLESLDPVIYKEYDQATDNIREKIKYKDLQNILENKGIQKMVSKSIYSGYPKIDSNSEIYFYATWKDSKEEFYFKYAIFDAKTKKQIVSGSDFALKNKK